MNVTFIGLGLIGGSAAIALRKSGFATRLVGVESNAEHAKKALELGLVDELLTLDEALPQADLVVLAIPVDAARELLPHALDLLKKEGVLVDMGSTKSGICAVARTLPNRGKYVASHPMAGTEYSGPTAALTGLFDGKKAIVCEHNLSSDFALNRVLSMYRKLNMDVLFYTNPDDHDRHVAYVSHISHVSSFMLGLTVLEVEKSEERILDLAGTGFESTVRLAKSSPETWTPIFIQNSQSISHALETYIDKLQLFKNKVDAKDFEGLRELMTKANEIRKIIK